jgi:hypothetical protein
VETNCRALPPSDCGIGRKPLEAEAEAAGILAQVIRSRKAETARNLAGRISSAAERESYALAADAIICDRVARLNPGMAEPRARLAESLSLLEQGENPAKNVFSF